MGSRVQACQLWYTVQLPCGMWNLPGPGTESAFPTLAGISLRTTREVPGNIHFSSIFIRWEKNRHANSNFLWKCGIGPLTKEAAVSKEIVYSWQVEI